MKQIFKKLRCLLGYHGKRRLGSTRTPCHVSLQCENCNDKVDLPVTMLIAIRAAEAKFSPKSIKSVYGKPLARVYTLPKGR